VLSHDVLTTVEDSRQGEPLIEPVMKAGKRVSAPPSLDQIRERAARQLSVLPEPLRDINSAHDYEVCVSEQLKELAAEVDREFF
jgi:nicotinate phosphoribosyltransferase